MGVREVFFFSRADLIKEGYDAKESKVKKENRWLSGWIRMLLLRGAY
jgi:hypothetical protein